RRARRHRHHVARRWVRPQRRTGGQPPVGGRGVDGDARRLLRHRRPGHRFAVGPPRPPDAQPVVPRRARRAAARHRRRRAPRHRGAARHGARHRAVRGPSRGEGAADMKVWAIVATALLRFTRDRFNLFFVFVLPLAIVLLIGLQYGDVGDPQLGLVVPADDTLGDELRQRLAEIEDLEVVDLDTRAEVLDRVDDGELDAGLVVPEGFSSSIADGEPIELTYVSAGDGLGPQLQNLVGDALSRTLAVPTAVHAAVELGADEDAARAAALGNESMLELLEVRTVTAGDRLFPEGTTGYDVGATGQLVLFVFLTSLTGSAAIIQSRRLGVTTRMLSTPTPVR